MGVLLIKFSFLYLRFLVTELLRLQICNAVAVAGLLNATLVIPRFDVHNIWKDPR